MNIKEIQEKNMVDIEETILLDSEEIEYSKKWTEHEAVIFVQSELNKYNGIFDPSDIRSKDKGISYDGHIEVMKYGKEDKKEMIGIIDTQVKGTCVNKISKGNSKFTIDVSDLVNYAKNLVGALLFVVQIEKETKKKKIFYRYLLPIDLEKIFRTIDEQKTKTIDIYPIDSNQKTMLKNICLRFLQNKKEQVGKRIVVLDGETNLLEVKLVDCRTTESEFLKNKVYMYVKLNEDEGLIPALLPKNGKLAYIREVHKEIIINGKKYYNSYKQIIEDEKRLLKYGNGIIYNVEEHRFNFEFKGTIDEQINDMEFSIAILKEYKLEKEEVFLNIQKRLNKINEFKENLKRLNIDLKECFSSFNASDFENMNYLNRMLNKKSEVVERFDKSTLFEIKINSKTILLYVHKLKNTIEVYNFFGGLYNKIAIFSKINGKFYRVSEYALLTNSKIEDYINYDEKKIKISIKESENNEPNLLNLNLLLLTYISAYDRTKNENYYKMAEFVLKKLLKEDSNNSVYIINKMQLIKRKRNLTQKEKSTLNEIKENTYNNMEKYCISILLENNYDIEKYYKKLSRQEKKDLEKFPIVNLIERS